MSTSNPYAPKSKSPEEAPTATVEQEDQLEVPKGTVSEILDWVGDDKERVELAIAAEKDGLHRKSLLASLESLHNTL